MKITHVVTALAMSFGIGLTPSVWSQTAPTPAKPAKAAAAPAAKPDPLKGLRKDYDEMKGVAWYHHPSAPRHRNANGVYLYFGKYDNGTITPLRFVLQYYADDWLFVSRAWAKADSATLDLPHHSNRFGGWERDNSGGMIWEWSDAAIITAEEKALIRTLANSKKVTVRYEGRQYYNDRKMSDTSLKAMRDMITAYEAATGKPWN